MQEYDDGLQRRRAEQGSNQTSSFELWTNIGLFLKSLRENSPGDGPWKLQANEEAGEFAEEKTKVGREVPQDSQSGEETETWGENGVDGLIGEVVVDYLRARKSLEFWKGQQKRGIR